MSCIDGISLDRFRRGSYYDVGSLIGALFLAEGWAEPVDTDDPASMVPSKELEPDALAPPNLIREIYPFYYDGPPALARERRRHSRRRPAEPSPKIER